MPVVASFLLLSPARGAQQAASQQPPPGPRALVDGLHIERFGDAPPRAVRFAADPLTGDFLCITFDGELVRIRRDGTDRERLAGPEDHGITRELQGLAVDDSTIYLTGNVPVNDGYGTQGRLAKGRLQPDGSRTWSTVFTTEEFGTVKTAFDHGFNATVLSPDRKSVV